MIRIVYFSASVAPTVAKILPTVEMKRCNRQREDKQLPVTN